MKAQLISVGLSLMLVAPGTIASAEGATCQTIRLAETGWTDLALTNSTASLLLEALGYSPEQTHLSLNLTYEALKNEQIDLFLGNWIPVQETEFKSYFDNGDVEIIASNLTGAKFTLAVPGYVAEGGVKSFDDLAEHAEAFESSIYGIEPGANKPLLEMVKAGRHGLAGWQIVESSEAAMLAQVDRMTQSKDWVVFLAWEPHPMNIAHDLVYLSGGEVEYGPDYGGAEVRTLGRTGYMQECPNIARLMKNLTFDLDYENQGMAAITNDGREPADVVRTLVARQPELLEQWLAGVTTKDGDNGLEAARDAFLN